MADADNAKVDPLCGMHHFASVCKSLLLMRRRSSDKNNSSPNKIEAGKDLNLIDDQPFKEPNNKDQHNNKTINTDAKSKTAPPSPRGYTGSFSNHSQPLRTSRTNSPLSRSESQKRHSTGTKTSPTASMLKSISRKCSNTNGMPEAGGSGLSRSSSTRIMYSNSNGARKPPDAVYTLECTLEETCFGCKKQITVPRDVVTNNGQIGQKDEVLTLIVQPGWKTGIKITFDGKGNETPGGQASDVIFVVEETQHPLFRRDGDDLILQVKIPLVNALTSDAVSIPLLDGGNMNLQMENTIIQDGYQQIVAGQGMPKYKQNRERGNLIVNFQVEFPKELTAEQRADVLDILKDCC